MHILFLDSGCRFCDFGPWGENAEWSRSSRLLSTQSRRGKMKKSLKIARFWMFLLMVCNGRMPVCHVKCVCACVCSSSLTFRSSSSLCRAARRMSWSFLRRRAVRTSSQPGGNSSVHRMSKRPGGCSRRGTSFPGIYIQYIDFMWEKYIDFMWEWHMNISSPSDICIMVMQRKISFKNQNLKSKSWFTE